MAQPVKLSPEQCAAFIAAMQAAVAAQGYELHSGAQALRRFLDRIYPLIEAAQSPETLMAALRETTATDTNEITQIILALAAFSGLLQAGLNNTIQQAAKEIPTPLGPPVKVTPEIERSVIQRIGELHLKGVPIGIAQTRTAQATGLSKRTVQRIWKRRKELAEQPFQSLEDVWSMFMKK